MNQNYHSYQTYQVFIYDEEYGSTNYICWKSKNLRNRIRSYFRGAHATKTTKLVADIYDFETIITNSDKEALILEINLIQQYIKPTLQYSTQRYYHVSIFKDNE